MKEFSIFSFILGVAGGAALAAWVIKEQSKTAANTTPTTTGKLPATEYPKPS